MFKGCWLGALSLAIGCGGGGATSMEEAVECAEGQSSFTATFSLTDLSPTAPSEGEPFESVLGRELVATGCVDRVADSTDDPLKAHFESNGTIEFHGPGADFLSTELVESLAAPSFASWEVIFDSDHEPSIVNFSIWGSAGLTFPTTPRVRF